jgi:hypothetical protein
MTYFVCARATEHDAGWKLNASLTHAADRELTRDAYHPGVGSAVHRQRNDVAAAAAAAGTHKDAAAWAAMDSWSCDMWLTPGSVVMHSFSLRSTLDPAADPSNAEFSSAPGGGEDRLRDIASLAKSAAKGKLFEICSAEAGDDEEPHIFLCKGGLTVRLHCDGTTTPVLEIDPAFRARTLSSCHAMCSSPSVRWTDITVPGVPRGIKFEGRFHGSTLLRVEELSRCPSSNSSSTAAERREDVRIRVHLPGNPLGAARVEAVWAEGACRNLIAGAGFPILLVPAENIAEELRTRLLGPSGGGCGVPPGVTSRESTRGFVQQAGHALHAALRKHPDQGVAQQTAILHNAAGTPRLPLFSALLRFAADYLDHALELQDIDEMLAEEAAAEADMKRQSFCKQEKAGGGAPPGDPRPPRGRGQGRSGAYPRAARPLARHRSSSSLQHEIGRGVDGDLLDQNEGGLPQARHLRALFFPVGHGQHTRAGVLPRDERHGGKRRVRSHPRERRAPLFHREGVQGGELLLGVDDFVLVLRAVFRRVSQLRRLRDSNHLGSVAFPVRHVHAH